MNDVSTAVNYGYALLFARQCNHEAIALKYIYFRATISKHDEQNLAFM